MKSSEIISKLLKKYKLTKEIPDSLGDHIHSNLKPSLKRILRQKNSYGIASSFLISLKIFARRFGIRAETTTERRINLTAAFAAALIFFISLYSLKDKLFMKAPTEGQRIILSRGHVNIIQKKRSLPSKINATVPNNAVIKTGTGSHIFFQNPGLSLTGVMENSEAKFMSRSSETGSEIILRRGLILSRVKKLQKKQEYIIRTPNSVTYVRGTAFSVKYQKNLTEVALASGKIILKNKTGSEEVLKEGETAVISNNIHIRKISEIELLQIQKIMLLNFIKESGPGKSSIAEKQAGQYELELGKIDKEIEKLVETERIRREKELEKWKRLPPLERLRREGKIITMFHMRDGSRVAGSILSQDKAIIELDTGDGIIKIIKNEIIRRVKI